MVDVGLFQTSDPFFCGLEQSPGDARVAESGMDDVFACLKVIEVGGARDFVQENTEEEAFSGSGMYAIQAAANGVGVVGPKDPLVVGRIPPIVVHDIRVLEGQVGMLWFS